MKEKDDPFHTGSLDGTLLSPTRMAIIVLLAMYEEADFTFLKNELGMSDGNLGANMRKLEDENYITSRKMFVGRKPKTSYRINAYGLEKLKNFIESMKKVELSVKTHKRQ